MQDNDAWKARIEQSRVEKDEYMKTNLHSPIPLSKRRKFPGLNYFQPDQNLYFKLQLHEHSEKQTIEVKDSKGNDRQYIRWGEFSFNIDGQDHTLQAYKSDPKEERLFVPFKDATSGKDTYGAGRYLDLEEEHDLMDGKWTLDFNEAYNPYCAYSHNYACPLVPLENWLKVPIRAGEKNYSK